MNGFELKDDSSWLVYADWLEERGDQAAAAVIRAALVEEPEPQDQWGVPSRIDAGDVGIDAGTVGGSGIARRRRRRWRRRRRRWRL